MSKNSKTLGIIGVWRVVGWTRRQIFEALYFTSDKVIVARTATGFQMSWGAIDSIKGWNKAKEQEETMDDFSVEEILSSDQNNFAISYDKIEKVELKKFGKGAFINVIANGKKHHWNVRGIPGIKNFRIENLEKILRPIFQEKLVKSSFLKL
jgi:hypothetical protein